MTAYPVIVSVQNFFTNSPAARLSGNKIVLDVLKQAIEKLLFQYETLYRPFESSSNEFHFILKNRCYLAVTSHLSWLYHSKTESSKVCIRI